MTEIVFSPEAKLDLAEAGDYITFKLRNKPAARNLIKQIQQAVQTLARFPESGTPLAFTEQTILYRYLICGNYMIFYHLEEDTAYIDRILYGRRDYLAILFGNKLADT